MTQTVQFLVQFAPASLGEALADLAYAVFLDAIDVLILAAVVWPLLTGQPFIALLGLMPAVPLFLLSRIGAKRWPFRGYTWLPWPLEQFFD